MVWRRAVGTRRGVHVKKLTALERNKARQDRKLAQRAAAGSPPPQHEDRWLSSAGGGCDCWDEEDDRD